MLPLPDDASHGWLSISGLAMGKVDEKTPGADARRAAQTHWLAARRAFLADDPEAFNAASASLFETLCEQGSEAESYPSLGLLRLEVLYNNVKPFRVAWVLMLATLVALATYYAFARQSLYGSRMGRLCGGHRRDARRLCRAHAHRQPRTGDEHV